MDAAVLDRAVTLIRESHLSPRRAVMRLHELYPALELGERVRYIEEAYDIVVRGKPLDAARGAATRIRR